MVWTWTARTFVSTGSALFAVSAICQSLATVLSVTVVAAIFMLGVRESTSRELDDCALKLREFFYAKPTDRSTVAAMQRAVATCIASVKNPSDEHPLWGLLHVYLELRRIHFQRVPEMAFDPSEFVAITESDLDLPDYFKGELIGLLALPLNNVNFCEHSAFLSDLYFEYTWRHLHEIRDLPAPLHGAMDRLQRLVRELRIRERLRTYRRIDWYLGWPLWSSILLMVALLYGGFLLAPTIPEVFAPTNPPVFLGVPILTGWVPFSVALSGAAVLLMFGYLLSVFLLPIREDWEALAID